MKLFLNAASTSLAISTLNQSFTSTTTGKFQNETSIPQHESR